MAGVACVGLFGSFWYSFILEILHALVLQNTGDDSAGVLLERIQGEQEEYP